jgi:hypothetical protein
MDQTPPATSDDKTPILTESNANDQSVDIAQSKATTSSVEKPLGFRKCRSVEEYDFLNQIGSGTYGVVCKYFMLFACSDNVILIMTIS